jgi:small subunit ribosomal protein S1
VEVRGAATFGALDEVLGMRCWDERSLGGLEFLGWGGEDGGVEKRRRHEMLEVVRGVVVGVSGGDVIVELGVRMQGVLGVRCFEELPGLGEEFDFTLGGREDGLWALSLVEEPSLVLWEDLEVGSLVPFQVVRRRWGGLEGRIGKLHAFMPGSHGGVEREADLDGLLGRILVCEVLEVDGERQRAVVSRRVAKKRARESAGQREASGLRAGQVVEGRVSRVEDYGVFVKFGAGVEGLIHVSNMSHERVDDVGAVMKVGDRVEAKVLQVKRGGKRVSLGVKQMGENPWVEFGGRVSVGDVLEGAVVRVLEFGAFVGVVPGVDGLLPRSEMGLGRDEPVSRGARVGDRLSLRVIALEVQHQRLSLSLLHADGARIAPGEVGGRLDLAALADELGAAPPGSSLGKQLRRALLQGEGTLTIKEDDQKASQIEP